MPRRNRVTPKANIDSIFLLAPTSEDGRVRLVVERVSGFLYLVSLTGMTGARDRLPPDLESFFARAAGDRPPPRRRLWHQHA
jgi:tryptophan synthase alpha chain